MAGILVTTTLALAGVATAAIFGSFFLRERAERMEIRELFLATPNLELLEIDGGYDVGVNALTRMPDGTEILVQGVTPDSFDGDGVVAVHRIDQTKFRSVRCNPENGWTTGNDALSVGRHSKIHSIRSLGIDSIQDLVMHYEALRQAFAEFPRCAPHTLRSGETYHCIYENDHVPLDAFECSNPPLDRDSN